MNLEQQTTELKSSSSFWKTMLSPETQEEKSKRFWTAVGSVQLAAFWGAGGVASAALPAGVTAAIVVYTALKALEEAANSEKPSQVRTVSRKAIHLLFGEEGKNSQARRRLLDAALSVGAAAIFGWTSATGMVAGICTGAALTLVTTWQKGANPEWNAGSINLLDLVKGSPAKEQEVKALQAHA